MEWPSTWPNEYGEGYQMMTGSYGGTDDRFKRRKKKQPLGFAPPKPRPQAKRKGKS